MSKIGIDIRMLGSQHGGIGRYVFELVRHLLPQDQRNSYVLFFDPRRAEPGELESLAAFSNVRLIPAPIRHYSLGEQTSFLRLLNREALDLVHFPNFNFPIFYQRPFVVTIHDMVHHKISGAKKSRLLHFWAYKQVIETAAKKSQKIITVSEFSKKDIAKYFELPPEKITVAYEGASLNVEVSESETAAVKRHYLLDKPYFLFVGVLERKKNLINLTRGFDAMLKKYQLDMDLVIAGKSDKHYPEIKHKALDIQFKDRLVFTGEVAEEHLPALYRGAYGFVSASLHEGFGLPGVEAMQFGLPLAVSNIEVFNEVYDDAAVYFNPLDPEDIAEKLNLLGRDQQFHKQLQEKSFRRGQLYSWEKTAQQTLEVYRQALKF